MIDWNPLVTAAGILLIALAGAIPGLMAYFTAKRNAIVTAAVAVEQEKIMHKVDGNYSDLKKEMLESRAETKLANQQVATLTERLIQSVPASASPATAVAINGVERRSGHDTVAAPVLVLPPKS